MMLELVISDREASLAFMRKNMRAREDLVRAVSIAKMKGIEA